MKVGMRLPEDAVNEHENPYRTVEMPHAPRVGDLIHYSDVDSLLKVKEVTWYIEHNEYGSDLAQDATVVTEWSYAMEAVRSALREEQAS